MKPYKVLLIEDDLNAAENICKFLSNWGFQCNYLQDFQQIMAGFIKFDPEIVLLDVKLPHYNGFHWCEEIRKISKVPIIFISSVSDNLNMILAMNMGGDDYVTKPFDIKEVTARVEVQIRRAETTGRKEEEHRFTYQELELNKGDFTVKVGNTELPHITKQEFSILELLLKHPKKVFSKEEMFEYAWEEQYMGETKTLDVHISNIRKKIKAVTDKEYIETVWGIGYRLHP